MGELRQDLIDGLPGLGGPPSPPPVAPPQPMPTPISDLYVKLRAQGLDDTNAAIEAAKHLRYINDLRSTFREAGHYGEHDGYNATADRAELMSEADKPLADLAERLKVGQTAADETERRQKAIQGDIGLNQQVGLLDPAHPTNRALQQFIAKTTGVDPATLGKVTVAQYPGLKDAISQYAGVLTPTLEPKSVTALHGAQAASTGAEVPLKTAQAAATGAEVPLKGAETGKTQAETGKIQMETSGQVAPGLTVAGTQAVTQKDRDELKAQKAATDTSSDLIDQIIGLTKGKDWISDPKVHAALAPRINSLVLASKEGAGIRGLPEQDVAFLQKMAGNYDPWAFSNFIGITHNRERLLGLKTVLYNKLKRDAAARGVTFTMPGAAPSANAPATQTATHYRYSPDKKLRVPTDASGKQLGAPEPNPDAPPVPNG